MRKAAGGEKKLTRKQEMFVKEYLIDLNATRAAIRAGYEWGKPEGYYVYFLVNPLDDTIFYVGKGSKERVRKHAISVKKGKIDNAPKAEIIGHIHDMGFNVTELVFSCGLSETDAYIMERGMIDCLKGYGLTNIAGGVVTNKEKDLIVAKRMLARLRPFEDWVKEAEAVEQAKRIWGDARVFYDWFKESIETVIARVSAEC